MALSQQEVYQEWSRVTARIFQSLVIDARGKVRAEDVQAAISDDD